MLLFLNAAGCDKPSEQTQFRPRRMMVPRPPPRWQAEPSPDATAAQTASDDLSEVNRGANGSEIQSGLFYQNDHLSEGPWSVNILKIDRSRAEFELTTTLGRGRTLGLGTISEQIGALPPEVGKPLAAVNGDFYRTEGESFAGDPRGVQIARGELISAPNGKTAFWINADKTPMMGNLVSQFRVTWPDGKETPFGLNEERSANTAVLYTSRSGPSTRARGGRELILVRHDEDPWLPLRPGQVYTAQVKEIRESGNSRIGVDTVVLSIGPTLLARTPRVASGDVIRISTATTPSLEGVTVAIGGGPVLLHDGKVQPTYTNKAQEQHPRSAFGWNDQYFFFAEVDGRQYGFSVGMTLPQLAAYLARQGCKEAMNLDGGGSAEMWIHGQVVNRPCFGYERNTANALVLVEKPRMAARE